MSLRYQINLRIILTLAVVLFIGGGAIIFQARLAVAKEVQSSVQLALQLINLSLHQSNQPTWLHALASLKQTRHLKIHLQQASGKMLQLGTTNQQITDNNTPHWFVWLVEKPYPVVSYALTTLDNKTVQIKISANALDEIAEAWQETQMFFSVILLLSGGLLVAVNLIFQQVLHTVEQILTNLNGLEHENYHNPLPAFRISEFGRIAQAINHLTATLHKAEQENQRLTLHSLEISEEQRQTLAQELHDELGQSITAIKVMAVTGKKKTPHPGEAYQSIIGVCDHLFKVVRSMMRNLHPLVLTELGLTASLHDLSRDWQERTALKIDLNCAADVDRIPAKMAIQVFRIIQEAVTNTVRHAQARQLTISLQLITHATPQLSLSLKDDGIGCDINNLRLGFGLLGIQARVKSLKGFIRFDSQQNQGFNLQILLPVVIAEVKNNE